MGMIRRAELKPKVIGSEGVKKLIFKNGRQKRSA